MRKSASLPTTHDVARLAGVSRATVSFVLNGREAGRVADETRERVLSAAETLGYRPNRLASALSTGRTYTIGIVSQIDAAHNVADQPGRYHDPTEAPGQYAKNVFLAVTVAAAAAGLNTTLFLETLDSELKPEDVADGRVDGIVIFGMYDHHDWVRRVVELKLPCVEIGTRWGRHWVEADNHGGTRLAIDYLRGLGHERIAFFLGLPAEPVIPFIPTMSAREAGFRAAMKPADDADKATPPPVVRHTDELAALFAPTVPPEQRPTAVLTYNDAAAIEALDTLRGAGLRVPDDVSVVGFDNELRSVIARPMLTTVQNPVSDIAHAAVAMLRRQIDGVLDPPEGALIPTRLVVRDSAAAPPRPES